ncbi:hypothetical protein ACFLU6_10125 [Acidobacteriota bacterium]
MGLAARLRLISLIMLISALGSAASGAEKDVTLEIQVVDIGRAFECSAPLSSRHFIDVFQFFPDRELVLFTNPRNEHTSEGSTPESPSLDSPESSLREKYRPSRFNLSVNGGVGLIRSVSPYTLSSGEVASNFSLMNYDRYPGDVDFVEVLLQGALGLPRRTEFFFRFSPRRNTNSVGHDPMGYPIPPLDLFIDIYPTPADRLEPYFLYAQEAPYKTYYFPDVIIVPPGNGAYSFSPGDNVFGLKLNILSEDRDHRLGLGLRGYLELPTETPKHNDPERVTPAWRHLTGVSGEPRIGFDLLLSKMFGKTEILANIGYKHVGDPSRGLRIQYVDSSAGNPEDFLVGEPIEMKLDLKDVLNLNAGVTVPAFKLWREQVWAIGEFSYERYIGSGTRVTRLVHPAEMRLGLQFNVPGMSSISVGCAFQLLFNDAGDGQQRRTNFMTPDGMRGDINFGEMVDPALSETVKQYFLDRGAGFSENSGKVFATNNPAFDAWRNIPTEPTTVIGQGGGAALFYVTWRIGSLW